MAQQLSCHAMCKILQDMIAKNWIIQECYYQQIWNGTEKSLVKCAPGIGLVNSDQAMLLTNKLQLTP